ncbi:MAG TPA: hypothetical protein VM100_02220 [Longimicrobiales bacterium]|nr:hypothetical protein [Longimicrobiales bacterium]
MKLGLGIVVLAVLAFAQPASAQQRDTTLDKAKATGKAGVTGDDGIPPSVDQMRPDEAMGTSGFFLGMVSVLAGATFGSQLGQSHCPPKAEDKDCGARYGYTGALIAGTVMVPIGVHLVNSNRKAGDLLKSFGVSAALGSALYFGSRAIPGKPIAMGAFLAVPLQVFTSVKIEQRK